MAAGDLADEVLMMQKSVEMLQMEENLTQVHHQMQQ